MKNTRKKGDLNMSIYYAEKVGMIPGFYSNWQECQANVIGYPGAKYKSFSTLEEASQFVYGDNGKKEDGGLMTNKKEQEASGPIAYVDGSCDGDGARYAYGVVILDGDKEYHLSGVGDDPDMVSMRNVAGEILGSQAAMEYALKNGMKEITIYHDYQGISSWCIDGWKTNRSGTKAYKERYQEIVKTVNIKFVKVKGHSNVFYNDGVDALAKQALGIESGIKKNIAEHIENIKKNM